MAPAPVAQLPAISVARAHDGHEIDDLILVHALPLFGPNGLRDRLTDAKQETASEFPTTVNGNGKQPTGHLLGHPLPPFGPTGLPHHRFPIAAKVHAKRNGHTNGNVNGNAHALPAMSMATATR